MSSRRNAKIALSENGKNEGLGSEHSAHFEDLFELLADPRDWGNKDQERENTADDVAETSG